MEQIGDMMFVDFEKILERDIGKVGTPKRDKFERKVNETGILRSPSSRSVTNADSTMCPISAAYSSACFK